jgi:DNA-directed RNA polymerase I, II, and III subunit RPABC2
MTTTEDDPIVNVESDAEEEEASDDDANDEDDVIDEDDKKDDMPDDDDDEDDDGDDDDDDDDDIEPNEASISEQMDTERPNNINNEFSDDEDDDDDEDGFDEDYLKKIDSDMNANIISEHHHELKTHNSEEIDLMCNIVKNTNGTIIDPLHKTLPFVTRYERARVIGERAKQIEGGAKPFIEISDNVIDSYLIALKEFKEKKIPFIIRRPLPSGGSEYWRLKDLEIIN